MDNRIRFDAFQIPTDLYFRSKVNFHIWSLDTIDPRCPGGKLWPKWPHFDTYVRETDVRFEISASNYPWEHRNSKNVPDVIRGHWPPITSVDLWQGTTMRFSPILFRFLALSSEPCSLNPGYTRHTWLSSRIERRQNILPNSRAKYSARGECATRTSISERGFAPLSPPAARIFRLS